MLMKSRTAAGLQNSPAEMSRMVSIISCCALALPLKSSVSPSVMTGGVYPGSSSLSLLLPDSLEEDVS